MVYGIILVLEICLIEGANNLMKNKRVLLTGGTGFIGSHTTVDLLENGYDVILCDNLSNSSEVVLDRIKEISGKEVTFYKRDLRNIEDIREVFQKEKIDAVIHFAGLKAVGESVVKPLEYYENNLTSTINLVKVMREFKVNNLVFSSSATIYGLESESPLKEELGRGLCSNPYGWTKSMIEQILEDVGKADKDMSVVLLRYFNPVGAHPSGMMGENPLGIPTNLMPFITQVAIGKREKLVVFGNDYDTEDGTCLRDFIHVMDLASAHRKAIEYASSSKGVIALNIGTGTPYSVLDMIKAFEKSNGVKVNFDIGDRREGDLAAVYADPSRAREVLGWESKKTLDDMCRDSWKWQSLNPEGYGR